MACKQIDPEEFVASVQPMLEARDPGALLALLKSRWTREQIVGLLSSPCCDARKVAALALALVGSRRCLKELTAQLKHPDPMVNQMAEHAIWAIWFRLGTVDANHELCRGTKALNQGDCDQAIRHFTCAIELDPNFAEAYNQRAIAKYLQERYDESLEDCGRTVERMPCHFGAWAGMGHCHAHSGRLAEAAECYKKALAINPGFAGINQALAEISKRCG
ncbi:MAG TPA: tetratricopeptide repeat protein [Tepidisphaeraceae bacterium]|jgi:tetratricopeptide (TPR) repeat protein